MRESIDVKTRTLSLVVAVDKPYEKAIPGKRPPLVSGMFTEVELRGTLREGRAVVPRNTLRDGHVFLVSEQNRLVRHPVRVEFSQGDFFCVEDGLEGGERLVVSDPTPAIEGMLVDPVTDADALERLHANVNGDRT